MSFPFLSDAIYFLWNENLDFRILFQNVEKIQFKKSFISLRNGQIKALKRIEIFDTLQNSTSRNEIDREWNKRYKIQSNSIRTSCYFNFLFNTINIWGKFLPLKLTEKFFTFHVSTLEKKLHDDTLKTIIFAFDY